MATLTVIVHTKNSAATLEACLKSVHLLADQLIVMDMESTDNSVAIAKKFKATILHHADVGYVEPARNAAMQQATQDWTLILDSDEEISPSLAKNIAQLLKNTSGVAAYRLPRKNLIFGKWAQSGWWPDYQVRLFQTGKVTWQPQLHSQPTIQGETKSVPADEEWAILHHNYDNIQAFIDRAQRYSQIAAQEMAQGKRTPAPSLVTAWLSEFMKRWYALGAQKQGHYGETLSALQAYFEVLTLAQYWEQKGWNVTHPTLQLSRELTNLARQAKYWEAHTQWEASTGLTRLYWRIRMRLRL
jgi:hypothetical protein